MPADRRVGAQRILIAEDDDDIRSLASEILESDGFSVVAAADGEAALLALFKDAGIDLLLTDIRMPGALDGWALAERAQGVRPGLRVIYMTSFTAIPIDRPGFGPLLPKPWTAVQLLDCVRRATRFTPLR